MQEVNGVSNGDSGSGGAPDGLTTNINKTESDLKSRMSKGKCADDFAFLGTAISAATGSTDALADGGIGTLNTLDANNKIVAGTPSGNNPGQTTGYGSNVTITLNSEMFAYNTMTTSAPGLLDFGNNSGLNDIQKSALNRDSILAHELVHAMINRYAPVVGELVNKAFDIGVGQSKLAKDCFGFGVQ